jgi:hypothetical protein
MCDRGTAICARNAEELLSACMLGKKMSNAFLVSLVDAFAFVATGY